jgi:(p)ppGpp synthase/HD superfamily hydrolase
VYGGNTGALEFPHRAHNVHGVAVTGLAIADYRKFDGIDDVVVRLAKCCRPVPGGQVMDLADVHVPGAPALDDPHGPRPPLVLFLVRWQCSGSSRELAAQFRVGKASGR